MDIKNYYLLTAVVITIVSILPILFYVLPHQYGEIKRPVNEFTRLRWLIFIGEWALVASMFFGLPRKIQLMQTTPPANAYAAASTITNVVPFLILAIVLVLIYNYKEKA